MSADHNIAIARRLIEDVFVKRNPAALDELLAPNFRWNVPLPNVTPDRKGAKQFISGWLNAFPNDLRFTINKEQADGNQVILKVTWEGTHNASFMGFAPKGMRVKIPAVFTFKVDGDHVAEMQAEMDADDMRRQLGYA